MKTKFKAFLERIARHDLGWKIVKRLVYAGKIMDNARRRSIVLPPEFPELFRDSVVLNGPFKGLKYPVFDSVGSEIYPKLLGSYESELHETINYFIAQQYTVIIDVGCAEGYYANGLAMRLRQAKIFAYDTNEKGRELCREMAKLNNVGDRVFIGSYCSSADLKEFDVKDKGLIICDCEGFETELFNEENVGALEKFDLLIETHDFIDIEISDRLVNLFSKTHAISIIQSIDDIAKAKTYNYVQGYSLKERKKLYSEKRPAIMEWLVCISNM